MQFLAWPVDVQLLSWHCPTFPHLVPCYFLKCVIYVQCFFVSWFHLCWRLTKRRKVACSCSKRRSDGTLKLLWLLVAERNWLQSVRTAWHFRKVSKCSLKSNWNVCFYMKHPLCGFNCAEKWRVKRKRYQLGCWSTSFVGEPGTLV